MHSNNTFECRRVTGLKHRALLAQAIFPLEYAPLRRLSQSYQGYIWLAEHQGPSGGNVYAHARTWQTHHLETQGGGTSNSAMNIVDRGICLYLG